MYFTQEDYIKIENWLQANSVKDTEFPEASSLSLNEQLTIIQRGENKRIKLEDLVNFLFSQSDSELDTSSTKPIQNQAVARAIYELQNRKFIEIVEELPPTSNAKDNVVYILLDEVGENNNLFTEWIKVNNIWEKVGEFNAEIDLTPYLKIQDSPFEKGDAENSAILKGGDNKVTNANEVAIGKYNKSNSDTCFSVGMGESDTDRKNAFEVKMNGDIHIEGVEGRIQDRLNESCAFNPKGIYSDLTAGDLAGRGESVPAEFGFRASGGKSIKDGRAYIKRIKGNSVVWNQKVEKTYIDGDRFLENIDVIPQNHKFALIRSKALGGCYYMPSVDVYNYVLTDGEYAKIFVQSHVGDAEYSRIYSTGESGYIQLIDLTQMFDAGNEPSTIEDFNARVATLGVDMNAYNEGQVIHCNTESIKSVGDNAWDEEVEIGSISSNSGENIPNDNALRPKNYIKILPNEQYHINVPFNEHIIFYDERKQFLSTLWQGSVKTFTTPSNAAYMRFRFNSTYGTTYNHDIMITLVHSGWKQDTDAGYQPYWQDTLPLPIIRKYFPDGMKSAGSAHDEIRYNKASGKWEYSKGKIKSVDMGTLGFEHISENDPFFRVEIPLKRTDVKQGQRSQLLCAIYSIGDTTYYSATKQDKTIYESFTATNERHIYIKDSSYTDAATFKAAMQGVMLYYEAAEWEWVELDAEDQNFRDYYNVADFGTEEAIPATDAEGNIIPSAAFSADIIYQFNAVDMIREHELEITELQSIITEQQSVIATMQAQLASLTSNH